MYTILGTSGAFYVDADNATLVFDALRSNHVSVSFRTEKNALPSVVVTLAVDDVLAVLAHDAEENADLRAWRSQRSKSVVSIAEYLASRGRAAVATLG
ncbi:MAG: hypothetical protein M3169_15590 [Candidatus Eremiobacteraeota bacterium]|nr:hypothetical protein [Candidatus Eremiobacteraeota bacterium]